MSAPPRADRYLARNRWLRAGLTAVDALLDRLPRQSAPTAAVAPRRVLLGLRGHLGDAVIFTAALRALRAALPEAEVGVVLPSWTLPVLRGHPDIHWTHVVDHWHSNRAAVSRWAKWRRYRATRATALREIRAREYDVAVDLGAFFPNVALLLWEARIPVRIGYTSGGFGGLYSHPVPWRGEGRPVTAWHIDLLREIPGVPAVIEAALPALPPADPAAQRALEARLASLGARAPLAVVHMGAGSPEKRWTLAAWRAVVAGCASRGLRVVLTGHGAAECADTAAVAATSDAAVDLGGRLDWDEFVALIRGARLVVTVDTVASHVAAAVGTPCVVAWAGEASIAQWRPQGDRAEVVRVDDGAPDPVADVLAAVARMSG